MINVDQDALECDLAETYHIFNYKELSPRRIALFSCGLRDNSRIKLKLADSKYTLEQILMINTFDALSMLLWVKAGAKKDNRPQLLSNIIFDKNEEDEYMTFADGDQFEKARQEIIEKGE
ncbi:MAG: hypothetical protein ACLRT4_18080 [Thomasclavelia sp.]